jgi:predicted N-acetyltransferase YhbS
VSPESLAALCAAAMPGERLTAAEIAHICFGAGDEVIGDDDGAVAWTVRETDGRIDAWILLLAVRPERRSRGLGKELGQAAIARARAAGARTVHLANAVPRYVWPGVDLTDTREALGFARGDVAVNMAIPTSFRRSAPPGITVERERGDGALRFAHEQFPHWVPELEVAVAAGTAFAARDDQGATVGFGCHSCNRVGWIGPMATDATRRHGGVGAAVLAAVCTDLDARGFPHGEIAWVSNLRFYGKCGATVSRVFQGGALRL